MSPESLCWCHYQAVTSDNIEDLVFSLVICRVCMLVRVLQLFVVTSCKCSLNAIISLNPASTYEQVTIF
jgi:hypothetical protein